jgi:hypothetical protein
VTEGPDHVRRNRAAWNQWAAEAARLLRPGGRLIFLVNSVLMMLTIPDEDGLPATDRLLRPTSACTGSNGRTTTRSNSTSATAT